MKKLYFLVIIFIFILPIVACKANQKPKGDNTVTRDPPPEIPAGATQEAAYSEIYTKLGDSYIGDDTKWGTETLLKGSFDSLKSKTLIYHNDSQWIVLGIADNGQDVFVGTAGDGNFATAANSASKEANWDSRKLFYYVKNGGNVHFSWAARIGKPNTNTFTRFTGFDAKGGIPKGHDATNTTIQDFDQVFLRDINGVNYYNKLSDAEKANAGNNPAANFIIEKQGNTVGSTTKRKAWMWNFWNDGTYQAFDNNGVRIVKPEFLRFGYTSSTGNTWYPGSTPSGSKSDELTDLTASSVTFKNTLSPIGKTIFTRSIDHSTGADKWNYSVNQAVFLATVVGYNVRMKTVTPREIGITSDNLLTQADWTLDTPFEIVVMEFSSTAYQDAKYDKWDQISDAPLSKVENKNPLQGNEGADTQAKNYRVYFIVGKK